MWNEAKGFLIVDEPILINGITYSGVNTDAWPIGMNFNSEIARNICEISYQNLDFPMLVDFDSAMHYCRLCERAGKKPRMLYCEALIDHSVHNLPQFANPQNSTYLGFDYAYPSGDYYSAVVNDIICQNKSLPTDWKNHLNGFGLLSTVDDLIKFVNERVYFAKEDEKYGQGMLFEKGNFVGFCVYSVEYSKVSSS